MMPTPRMTEDEIWSFITDAHTGIFTTLRRDGVPISLPVWFACLDRQIYANTRGKKLKRIANDSRASFVVESGLRWADLKAVHLTGTAEIVDLDETMFQRFRDEMDRKYAPFRTDRSAMPTETAEHYSQVQGAIVRLAPDARVLHWDNAKLTTN